MHILIIGAAGMVGRKLTAALIKSGRVGGREISRLTMADVVAPEAVAFGGEVVTKTIDLPEPGVAAALVADRPDLIFHLAAIVSGEAGAELRQGLPHQPRRHAAAARSHPAGGAAERAYVPRLVFTSSIAVFGAPFPEAIEDEFLSAPLTSYGTQKAIGELLLNDYSRKGFVDGIGIRLPTIVVRPGKPNAAPRAFSPTFCASR
jgi:nucleoside-diphosphate-sugar epimerase